MNSDLPHAAVVDTGRTKQRLTGNSTPGRNSAGSILGLMVRADAPRPLNTTDSFVVWPNEPDAIWSWLWRTRETSSDDSVANAVKNELPGLVPITPSCASASARNSTCGLPGSPTIRTSESLSELLRVGGSRTCSAVVSPSAVVLPSTSPDSWALPAASTNGSDVIGLLLPVPGVGPGSTGVAAFCCSLADSGSEVQAVTARAAPVMAAITRPVVWNRVCWAVMHIPSGADPLHANLTLSTHDLESEIRYSTPV